MKPIAVSKSQPSKHSRTNAHARQTVRVSSDLCYENAHGLVESISTLLATERPEQVLVDLAQVGMIDSSGLRALLQSRKLCEEAGVGLELACVPECVGRIINMSGFGSVFGLPGLQIRETNSQIASDVEFDALGWKISEHVAASDPSVIAILRGKVRDAAIEAGARDDVLCDIQIAAGEALTNAYKHGSPMKGENKITLRCMSCGKALVIEVEDEGTEFDPCATSDPDPKQMRECGMGIYLMRQAMDAVDFTTGCHGNKVRMVKWLDAAVESAERVDEEPLPMQLRLLG